MLWMVKLSLELLVRFINNVLKFCLVKLLENISEGQVILGVKVEKLKTLTKPNSMIMLVIELKMSPAN